MNLIVNFCLSKILRNNSNKILFPYSFFPILIFLQHQGVMVLHFFKATESLTHFLQNTWLEIGKVMLFFGLWIKNSSNQRSQANVLKYLCCIFLEFWYYIRKILCTFKHLFLNGVSSKCFKLLTLYTFPAAQHSEGCSYLCLCSWETGPIIQHSLCEKY